MPSPTDVGSAENGARRSSFYWGFLFLSAPKRRALADVYAYCRQIDDIVDSGALKPEEAKRMLAFWREEIGRLYAGIPTHSLSRLLAPHVSRYRLPREAFEAVIAGCEMDLEKNRYRTFAELEPYLQGVAVAVGRLCVEIFGHEHTAEAALLDYCKNMGYAFQLTNIIRDVGADLEKGRIYLPLDEIAAAGCSVEGLIRREHAPAFDSLMARQYERAKAYYRRARNCLDIRDRPHMAAGEVMARVYEGVLDQIRDNGYRVFFDKTSLPLWRKAGLALAGWANAHGFV